MTGAYCLDSRARPKKRYASERAAKRDLADSHRWRRRSEWPRTYLCPSCKGWHLASPRT